MKINYKQYRPLRVGEIMRKTDVFNDGHEIESFSVGKKMLKKDKKYYQAYREVKKS